MFLSSIATEEILFGIRPVPTGRARNPEQSYSNMHEICPGASCRSTRQPTTTRHRWMRAFRSVEIDRFTVDSAHTLTFFIVK